MKLSVRPEAIADLQDIRDYIARDSPRAARSVVSRIWQTMQQTIKSSPYIGRNGRDKGTREHPVRGLPYIVVYEIAEERNLVIVLSVVHGARDR
jgi:addiction module RelE/StbE family toxin